MPQQDLDIVLYGATGLTGRLTAAHLEPLCRAQGIRIGLAARSLAGLEKVRDDIGAPQDTQLLLASASDSESLDAMVGRTAAVLSTVGPYQLYGSELLRACARTGTDYLDVNGEPHWMAEMIGAHESQARQSGARALFSCGFDSVPFDLGVFFLQTTAIERTGRPVMHVASRVKMCGTASEGSVKTNAESAQSALQSDAAAALAADPYALVPGFTGVPQPDLYEVRQDAISDEWLAPFIMAPINSKSVHRTNHLLGHRYGKAFTYDEMFAAGLGESGRLNAEKLRAQRDILGYLAAVNNAALLDAGEAGFYEIHIAEAGSRNGGLAVKVRADHDPGYESTARIATQVASLLLKTPQSTLPGGIWTPTAAFGAKLVDGLHQECGISFTAM